MSNMTVEEAQQKIEAILEDLGWEKAKGPYFALQFLLSEIEREKNWRKQAEDERDRLTSRLEETLQSVKTQADKAVSPIEFLLLNDIFKKLHHIKGP